MNTSVGQSTCKPRDKVRYSLVLTCIDNQTERPTVVAAGLEVYTFLESHWTECIPPIVISPTLCINVFIQLLWLFVLFNCVTSVGVIPVHVSNSYPFFLGVGQFRIPISTTNSTVNSELTLPNYW